MGVCSLACLRVEQLQLGFPACSFGRALDSAAMLKAMSVLGLMAEPEALEALDHPKLPDPWYSVGVYLADNHRASGLEARLSAATLSSFVTASVGFLLLRCLHVGSSQSRAVSHGQMSSVVFVHPHNMPLWVGTVRFQNNNTSSRQCRQPHRSPTPEWVPGSSLRRGRALRQTLMLGPKSRFAYFFR